MQHFKRNQEVVFLIIADFNHIFSSFFPKKLLILFKKIFTRFQKSKKYSTVTKQDDLLISYEFSIFLGLIVKSRLVLYVKERLPIV